MITSRNFSNVLEDNNLDYDIIYIMEKFPYVNMPDYFTRLLQVNMQKNNEEFSNLSTTISKNKSLYALFNVSFHDMDQDLRIEKIINGVGWYGVRNRLASLFIYYLHYGQYPSEYKNNYAGQIIQFEEKTQFMTVDGYSRGFLLGMYLEMANVLFEHGHTGKRNINPLSKYCLTIDTIDQLLKQAELLKGNTIKIDFLLIFLAHLNSFCGRETALRLMKSGIEYHEIYSQFSNFQKTLFVENLLAYGSSISDIDFFITQ